MFELSLDHVSVAASDCEYGRVSFANDEEGDDAYFQTQLEFGLPTAGISTLKAINAHCVGIPR
jgi:hypothetical protein